MTRIDAEWVTAPASRAVMQALDEGFFVGGCVRNALLGAPVSDIDIATPLPPEEVQARLEAKAIKVVPTGLKHGTLTAVFGDIAIEVTTFRADAETDGRHAVVQFSTDMLVDAGRRDFTMNALYADRDGALIDPLGGLSDLKARRVRFIGVAADRICEDYLRILRFFRFHALYGADEIDPDGLAACARLQDGLDRLAHERIGWEMRKLLGAPDPAPAVASMAAAGILARCLPGADATALAPLVHLEATLGLAPDWRARLAVLGAQDRTDALRLSRAESAHLQGVRAAIDSGAAPAAMAYRYGFEAALTAALIVAASIANPPAASLISDLQRGCTVQFPVEAADLLALGLAAGPGLGTALRDLEARWIASDFSLDKAQLIAEVSVSRSN